MDALLVDECPVMPINSCTRPCLMSPRVKGYGPNLLDNHPSRYLYSGD